MSTAILTQPSKQTGARTPPTVSYKQCELDDDWDGIVIGSGIGGLGTAAILAKEGKRILVLERHSTAGGFTHVFRRPGYEWDVGLHYIGGVNRPDSQLRQLFDYVTDGNLKWADVGDVYDRIRFEAREYAFQKGSERFKQGLKEQFPNNEDQNAIDRYVDRIKEVSNRAQRYFIEKSLPSWLGKITGFFLRRPFMKYAQRSTLSVLEELTTNQELIGVLTGQWGDYGLPPSQSSFGMHSIVANHYLEGATYPVGGARAILENIAPVIQQSGGRIVIGAEVTRVNVQGNRAVGVRLEDGRELQAPLVISGAGFRNTVGLLDKDVARGHGMDDQRQKTVPSTAHVSLYLGFQKTADELGLPKCNHWLFPSNPDHDYNLERFLNDPEDAELPLTFVSYPSAKDPDWERRHPGSATVEVISVVPYEWFKPWEDTTWKKRGKEYETLKEQLTGRLLEKLYEVQPQLRGEVDHAECSSPLSTRFFTGHSHGEIYGIEHSPTRFEHRFLRAHTPVKNLYLTGQDVTTAGVGGALASSLITTSAILKSNVPRKISVS